HDEQVDGVGRDPGVLDRVRARVDRHRRGRVGRGRDVTLADAGPLDDPRVGRVDTPFEIGVREELFRAGRAPAVAAGPHRYATRSQATGSPSRRRSPSCARRPASTPRNGLRTGVITPGPSITPTAWPVSTLCPQATSWPNNGRNTPTEGATITRSGTIRPSPWTSAVSIVMEPP